MLAMQLKHFRMNISYQIIGLMLSRVWTNNKAVETQHKVNLTLAQQVNILSL